PVWVFHGAQDEVVPASRSQELVDRLRGCDGHVRFTLYPDAGHDAWTRTYENPALYEWLLRHRRGAPGPRDPDTEPRNEWGRSMRRPGRAFLPLLLPLLPVVLAACGGDASASDAQEIRFWGMGREGEVVAELIREFEAENPDIRVRVQQIPWTAAHEKLLTAHVGNATPDVAQLGNTWIAEFSAIGALEPLDGWIAATPSIQPSSFFDGIWATNRMNDTTWGVPWYVDTRLIFYRSDILAAAGYDSVPQSWAGWLEAMQAVKRVVGPNRYAIFLPTNEWAQPVILGLQTGAQLITDDARGAFREPAFREAFDFYLSLFDQDLAPRMGQFDVANP